MSKEKLWELYLSKNPALLKDEIRFTQAGLAKFFQTTYDVAYRQGFRQDPDSDIYEEEEYINANQHRSDRSASFEELLSMFGMRR